MVKAEELEVGDAVEVLGQINDEPSVSLCIENL